MSPRYNLSPALKIYRRQRQCSQKDSFGVICHIPTGAGPEIVGVETMVPWDVMQFSRIFRHISGI